MPPSCGVGGWFYCCFTQMIMDIPRWPMMYLDSVSNFRKAMLLRRWRSLWGAGRWALPSPEASLGHGRHSVCAQRPRCWCCTIGARGSITGFLGTFWFWMILVPFIYGQIWQRLASQLGHVSSLCRVAPRGTLESEVREVAVPTPSDAWLWDSRWFVCRCIVYEHTSGTTLCTRMISF